MGTESDSSRSVEGSWAMFEFSIAWWLIYGVWNVTWQSDSSSEFPKLLAALIAWFILTVILGVAVFKFHRELLSKDKPHWDALSRASFLSLVTVAIGLVATKVIHYIAT